MRGLEVLINALSTDIAPGVRMAAAWGLGTLRLRDSDETDCGDALDLYLKALQAGCNDGEWIFCYAVSVAMESLRQDIIDNSEQHYRILNAMAHLASIQLEPTQAVRMRASLVGSRLINHWN